MRMTTCQLPRPVSFRDWVLFFTSAIASATAVVVLFHLLRIF